MSGAPDPGPLLFTLLKAAIKLGPYFSAQKHCSMGL